MSLDLALRLSIVAGLMRVRLASNAAFWLMPGDSMNQGIVKLRVTSRAGVYFLGNRLDHTRWPMDWLSSVMHVHNRSRTV
jgi:hypothetical protein